MFELLGLLAAGATAGVGYLQSRRFVGSRLRYVEDVQKPSAPVVAGVVAGAAALPVVWLLPLVGAGTALIFGTAVGLGTRAGAKDIRRATV